jgi:GNAT superfamily N-acetyltransferase
MTSVSPSPSHSAASTFVLESVDWADPRAVAQRAAMDVEMTGRYGGTDSASAELVARRREVLRVDPADVRIVLLAIDADGTAIGHAALRNLRDDLEVKRVIVDPGQRGRGVGRALMLGLEEAGRELGGTRLILQTGNKQPDAVALYAGIGYTPIAIYEPYVEAIPFSLCFEKRL